MSLNSSSDYINQWCLCSVEATNQRKAEHKRAFMKADPSNAVALLTASTLHAHQVGGIQGD